ncbi:tRNA (adenosine(37)-N6)-threonylcarbamoyltransferase complex transferase subunit TsaD [Candidatus Parcubacteria bacterium]|nr:tRNA (adenosine(37)-N6)-threonylcarbamoyltransferase complex transferase subunit TsaD [Candidatus Parcubacteria bacterium]
MKILAIETSCDETAICILECAGKMPQPQFKVLGNALVSQIHIHKEYGGVYPMLAKREHIKNLPIVLKAALKEAGESAENPNIDMIAVTAGPGLEPALWTGIEFAKGLGEKWGKPVVPINHMEGHLWSVLFNNDKPIEFPAIALLVSGGHTELVHVEGFDKFNIIGRTRDDAVGEAFDKVARLLDLPYPGGPKISAMAEIARKRESIMDFRFPRPMLNTDNYDFSYSGLKTSVLYTTRKLDKLDEDTKAEIAREFEEAAIEPLIEKTTRAIDEFGARTLIVGGGVSANAYLREKLSTLSLERGVDLRLPSPELTTDNAVMIAIAAYVRHLTHGLTPSEDIRARGNLPLS